MFMIIDLVARLPGLLKNKNAGIIISGLNGESETRAGIWFIRGKWKGVVGLCGGWTDSDCTVFPKKNRYA